MNKMMKLILISIFSISMSNVFANQAKMLNTYENDMVNKVWITTSANNQNNEDIKPSDSNVNGFFGIAEYYADGTFKMFTQEGKIKLKGDWSFSEDGKTRTIIAKKDDGSVMFTRTVENVTVSPTEYTYRIYPDATSEEIYFDIVHKPLADLLTQ